MAHKRELAQVPPEKASGLLGSYLIGFVLSVVLTLLAYFGVTEGWFSDGSPMVALLALAVVQLIIQLFFFLHVGRETRPRWKLLMLYLAVITVLVLVIGSLWVMYNLNYRMTPQTVEKYIESQNGGF